jgi:hypothetical protein
LSYDLHVFSQRALDGHELRELLAAAGLGWEEPAGAAGPSGSSTVTRGAGGRYCFTLGRPAPVEDEPDEVAAVLLGATCLYELLVEGSAASEIPHAVRFARRLAEASSGVVVDQQSGQTWSKGRLRTPDRVERGTIAVVQLTWYTAQDDAGGGDARAWLELARRLPEALPRRFGPVEPLAMTWDGDGPEAFVAGAATGNGTLYFKASSPCIGGGVAGSASRGPVRSHSLSVHREPLADPRWRDALQRFFVGFAARTGACFACAEVQRGLEWSGRSIAYGGRSERTTYLAARGRWAGLLPYPTWWAWYGPEYVPLVVDHLPAGQVERVGDALFHRRGAEPLDRDQLGPAGSPLPAELLAAVDPADAHYFNPPLTPASTMPPTLRPSP